MREISSWWWGIRPVVDPAPLTFWQHFRTAYPAYADSVATAFGERPRWIKQLIKWVAFPFTLEMVRLGHRYESLVNQDGSVQRASEWLLKTCSGGVTAHGAHNIPSEGALLIVANHAGMGDAIAIHTFLPRHDIYTVVFQRGLLAGLPAFVNYCIVIDEADPVGSIRQIVRVLKDGHAVLLFPYGQIEHDPALDLQQATQTLEGWSRSVEIITRHVKDVAVLPTAVGGVLSRRALRHPIAQRFKTFNRQSFFAGTLQLLFKAYRDAWVDVHFGTPLRQSINHEVVQAQMRTLLAQVHQQQTERFGTYPPSS